MTLNQDSRESEGDPSVEMAPLVNYKQNIQRTDIKDMGRNAAVVSLAPIPPSATGLAAYLSAGRAR